jgi:uncharacterized protein YoxC
MEALQHPITTGDFLALLSWIILLIVGLMLVGILAQVMLLLRDVSQFVNEAQNELRPMLRDIPTITHHVESLTAKADHGAETVEHGINGLKEVPSKVKIGVSSLFGGLKKSFSRNY